MQENNILESKSVNTVSWLDQHIFSIGGRDKIIYNYDIRTFNNKNQWIS